MKNIEDRAHEILLKLIETDKTDFDAEGIAGYAFEIAKAMQAEAEKRKAKEEWQPDWSQAPENAMYWAMDGCGQCNWYAREPEVCNNHWDFGRVIEQAHTGYDYQGDWKDSLRKRP